MPQSRILDLIRDDLREAETAEAALDKAVAATEAELARKIEERDRARIKRMALKELYDKAAAVADTDQAGARAEAGDGVADGEPEALAVAPNSGSGRTPIGALTNSQRDALCLMILREAGLFISRSDVLAEFEKRGYEAEIYHIKTILSRLLSEGQIVQLRYGTTFQFIVYGLPRFVIPEGDGYTFASDDVKPPFHGERPEEPIFEWNRPNLPHLLNDDDLYPPQT